MGVWLDQVFFRTHWEGRVGPGGREMSAEGWALVMNAGLGYFILCAILYSFTFVLCVSFIDFLHL